MIKKAAKLENGFDIHYGLRNVVYFLLMRSEDIYREIENMYLLNEQHYKEVLSQLEMHDSFYNGLQATDKWGILMLHAVSTEMEEADETAYLSFIEGLIKKSYKRIYDFAARNAFNMHLFMDFITNREPNLDKVMYDLYNYLYIYISKDLPTFKMAMTPDMKAILENIMLLNNTQEDVEKFFSKEIEKEAITYYQSLTGDKWRKNEVKYVRNIIVDIELQMGKKHPEMTRQIQRTANTRLMYKYKPLSYLRHALSVMQLLGNDNINFTAGIKITKEEFMTLYLTYALGSDKGFTEEDKDMCMMYALVQFIHHKAYRQLEDAYWDKHLSSNISELKDSMNQVEEATKDLEKKQQQFEKEKAATEKAFAEKEAALEARIQELEKQLAKSNKEIEVLEEQNKLMPVLQDALFERDDEIHPSYDNEADAIAALKEKFSTKQVVLVGGHDKFRKKFADAFEGLYVIAPEEKHVGLKQLEQADIILFDTSYNNHTQFERFKSVLHEQKIVFLNQGSSLPVNAERILKKINN